jgi:7-cyano-7-deazaguanine synthase
MSTLAVVLHSGGMDSTVCLLMAQTQGRQILSLGIDYNQRAKIELEYAKKLCLKFGIPRRVLRVEWDKPERHIPKDRLPEEMSRSLSPAFLPGRNAVFLALGCAEATSIEASEVWIGINSIDYSGYPDCRKEFVDSFQTMINMAIPKSLQIVAPLVNMSKPEIVREARRLGLKKDDTWSCYMPVINAGRTQPCGRCDGCVLHEWAWSKVTETK